MAKRKDKTISEQIRQFLKSDPRTRYRLSKLSGVDAGQLSRFVRGTGKLGPDTVDALGRVLRLRVVQDPDPKAKGE